MYFLDGKGTKTTSPNKTTIQSSEKKIDCKALGKEKQKTSKQKASKQQLSKTDVKKSMPTKPVTKKNENIVTDEQCKVKKVVQLKENIKFSKRCHHEVLKSNESKDFKNNTSEAQQGTKESNKDKELYSTVVSSSKCVRMKDAKAVLLKQDTKSWSDSLRLVSPRKCIYRNRSFVHQLDTAKHFCAMIRDHPHEGWMKRGIVPKMLLRRYYTDTYKPSYNKANPSHTIFQFSTIYHVSIPCMLMHFAFNKTLFKVRSHIFNQSVKGKSFSFFISNFNFNETASALSTPHIIQCHVRCIPQSLVKYVEQAQS